MKRKEPSPIVLGFLFAVPILLLFAWGISALDYDYQFEKDALRSTATVEKLWITTGNKGARHYHASYRYLAVGRTYSGGSIPVGPNTYQQLHIGQTVPIKFLVDHPGQSRIDWPIEDQYHWRSDEMKLCLGMVILVMGVLLIVLARFRRRAY